MKDTNGRYYSDRIVEEKEFIMPDEWYREAYYKEHKGIRRGTVYMPDNAKVSIWYKITKNAVTKNHERYVTIFSSSWDWEINELYYATYNFKMISNPERRENDIDNNDIMYDDIIFKTPNEVIAYIMENKFGFEVEMNIDPNKEYKKHAKKYVFIKG